MRVLYATDGSIPAREGEGLITALFEPGSTEVHVFSVEPEMVYLPDTFEASFEKERLTSPVRAEEIARDAAERMRDLGISSSWSYTRGGPAVEILRFARRENFDAVVLGASHSSWMGTVLLGSVSMHVLHQSPRPVIVTHRAPTGSGRVLLAVDGSDTAREAATFAGRALDPARCGLEVAMVVTEPWTSVAVYPPGMPFGEHADYEKAVRRMADDAWDVVERTARDLKRAGFAVETAVLHGSPGSHLLKEADNLSADLVVVGSRGHGPIKRAVLGSVSDQIARHAPAALVWRPLSPRS